MYSIGTIKILKKGRFIKKKRTVMLVNKSNSEKYESSNPLIKFLLFLKTSKGSNSGFSTKIK